MHTWRDNLEMAWTIAKVMILGTILFFLSTSAAVVIWHMAASIIGAWR